MSKGSTRRPEAKDGSFRKNFKVIKGFRKEDPDTEFEEIFLQKIKGNTQN